MTKLETESREESESGLDKIIEVCGDLYKLRKRIAYLVAFTEYVKYVQSRCFGAAVNLLSRASPDDFESFISRMNKNVNNPDDRRRVNEPKMLRNLRPCIGQDKLLRVDGR